MKLFIKIISAVAVSFVVLFLISGSLFAEDKEIPSSDKFIAVDVMPEMIHEETPTYPDHLRETQASVYVKAFVDSEGLVKKTEIAKSSGIKAFDDSALHAALKCKYKPAITGGNPIGVWVTYKVEFVPSNESAEKTSEKDLYENQDLDLMPEMLHEEEPVYPEKAKKENIEGTVWVKALVSEEGTVKKSEVSKSSDNELLDKSALDASLKCKFKPAVKDDNPISAWVTYRVDFVLAKEEGKKETE